MVDLFCRIWHHDWKATVYCCWLFSVTNHSYCLSTYSEGQMGKNMLMCLRKSHIMAFMCLKCRDFILEWLSCECCITKHTHSNEYLTTVLTQLWIIMRKKHCFCLCLLTTISEYFITGLFFCYYRTKKKNWHLSIHFTFISFRILFQDSPDCEIQPFPRLYRSSR